MSNRTSGAVFLQRFEACCFDWDGTAVATRHVDTTALRARLDTLSRAAMHCAIVTGTSFDTVDRQLQFRPPGPGTLLVATNRGSELFAVTQHEVTSIESRLATDEESAALDRAAAATVAALRQRGLHCEIVSARLNRRKIDLIPTAEWADPPKAQLQALLAAVSTRLAQTGVTDLRTAVAIASREARSAGCLDPRITSDAKHIEIGLTDKADAACQIAQYWWNLGIGPEGILVVGDEFGSLGGVPGSDARLVIPGAPTISVGPEPEGPPPGVWHYVGGPARFAAILDAQLSARRNGALPARPHHAWTLHFRPRDTETVRRTEALTTITDGSVGVRGIALHGVRSEIPSAYVNDVYTASGSDTALLPAPELRPIAASDTYSDTVLDLHTAVLYEQQPDGELLSLRFLAEPGALMLRDRGASDGGPLVEPTPQLTGPHGAWELQTANEDTVIHAAAATSVHRREAPITDLRVRYTVHARSEPPVAPQARVLFPQAFDEALDAHRRMIATQWQRSAVDISGDPDLERAVRFAIFQLQRVAPECGIGAIGARGLTGPAYRGHVFWDAEVFVLPFLAATEPRRARAVLEYRIAHLDAALDQARRHGYRGAQFPWESAGAGVDVTPDAVHSRTGQLIPIRTGTLEIHIVADIAWAIHEYLAWTDDDAFRRGLGARCLMEIARFWASRIRSDSDERAHIFGVIGPDEYHEPVDDNAFTNVMARNALRWAAELADRLRDEQPALATIPETETWLRLAHQLVDGYQPDTGLYEQCSGFFALEPLVIAEVAPRRPIAADLLLGRSRLANAQVCKQADVLMLHALVPNDVVPGSLLPNLHFYEPRTAHGSSLSPGIHALLYAQAGDSERCLDLLRIAAGIDLDDITQTTALGLHIGAMGSVWMACVWGILGCRANDDALHINPHVPISLGRVTARMTFRGIRVECSATSDTLEVATDEPVTLRVGEAIERIDHGRTTWVARGTKWERL